MHVLHSNGKCLTWMGACVAWVAILLFSSTSWAGRVSDRAFTRYITRHIRPYDKYDLYSRYHAHFLAEKDVHLIMFAVLGILLWRILPEMPSKAITVFLLGALVGCCSELSQSLFPGRDPAVRDALINK